MSGSVASCRICELVDQEGGPTGQWVLSDEQWFAGVLPGYDVPGWLVCGMRRHGEGPDSMNPEEASSFGIIVQRLSAALRTVTGAERLYLIAFGEEFPHLHFMLVPRPQSEAGAPRGVAYLALREELRDPAAAAAIAAEVQATLSRGPA